MGIKKKKRETQFGASPDSFQKKSAFPGPWEPLPSAELCPPDPQRGRESTGAQPLLRPCPGTWGLLTNSAQHSNLVIVVPGKPQALGGRGGARATALCLHSRCIALYSAEQQEVLEKKL